MTRDQHLEFCTRCLNREFDPEKGLVCSLTRKIADFDPTCENFKVDESVKVEVAVAPPVEAYKVVKDLTAETREALRSQQDLVYAIVGGLSAAIVGAILWTVVTVITHYQIGYMAIAVGLLVGFAVRYFGAGIDYVFGVVGAVFAVLGCALGNLLSQVVFLADAEAMSYFQVLTYLNLTVISAIFKESFSPMDAIFYVIAGYEGYKFAFRSISPDLINPAKPGTLQPLPYANLRFPIAAVLFIGLSVGGFFIHRSSTGVRAYFYESGAKHYEGMMEYGVEQGPWTFWWENGQVQQKGFFKDGKGDSTWEYFDEEGVRYRKGKLLQSLEHGVWEDYYADGQISTTRQFILGRLYGPFTSFNENGSVSQRGFYHHDLTDSLWETFYENGNPNSKGSFNRGKVEGPWTYWFENGAKSLEVDYAPSSYMRIRNSWTEKGVQQVKEGNGTYVSYYPEGTISETGRVSATERVGTWKQHTSAGKLVEEGEYRSGVYYLINSWSFEGQPLVMKGVGQHQTFYGEGEVRETGLIKGGLRVGEWITHTVTGGNLESVNYVDGKMNGRNIVYQELGEFAVEGNMKDDKQDGEWKWYHPNGQLESVVTFVNGQKQGNQIFYDDTGAVLRTEVYKVGERVDVNVN